MLSFEKIDDLEIKSLANDLVDLKYTDLSV